MKPDSSPALRIGLIYLIFGSLWIFSTDLLTFGWFSRHLIGELELEEWELAKGILYVVFTSCLIYWLVRKFTGRVYRSEHQYRQLFEENPNPMWVYDTESDHFVAVNEAALRQYGYSQEEFLTFSHKDLQPAGAPPFELRLYENGPGYQYFQHWRHQKKNGEIIYADIFANKTVFNEKEAVLVLSLDVTKQKDYEDAIVAINQTLEDTVAERTQELQYKNEELHAFNEELLTLNQNLKAANLVIEQQAQLLVKQGEDRLQRILHNIQDVIWSYDTVAKEILFINPAVEDIFGYTDQEFYENPAMFRQNILATDQPVFEQARQALQEEGAAEIEYRIYDRQGRIKHLSTKMWLEHNGENLAVRINGITSDITQQKQAETELFKRERLLSSLLQSQTNFLIRVDAEGRYTFTNQSFLDQFSRRDDYLPGRYFLEKVYPEDVPTFREVITECLENPDRVVTCELRKISRKGELIYTEWEFIGIQDETNKVTEIQGVGRNITQRKKATEQLEQYATRINNILESLTDAFFAVDRNWRFTIVNRECERIMGKSREELLGKYIWDEFYDTRELKFYTESVRALEQNISVHYEEYYAPFDDWYEVNAYPSSEGLSVYFRRINERKKAQEERNQLIEELIHKNSDLQQFAFITSHNLRAPVAHILGLIDLYKQPHQSELNPVLISYLSKAAQTLDTVIRDLNDLLAVRAHVSENRQEIFFEEVYQGVLGLIRDQIEVSHSVIKADFSEVPSVYSIRSYVQSMMLNLVSNAIKYRSPDRTLCVEIRSEYVEQYVKLSITDNGLGIDLEKNGDKVFGLYQRFHPHTEGKGMGLHMVKTQAEALGGKVTVDSQEGKGSTFSVFFQRLKSVNSPAASMRASSH